MEGQLLILCGNGCMSRVVPFAEVNGKPFSTCLLSGFPHSPQAGPSAWGGLELTGATELSL